MSRVWRRYCMLHITQNVQHTIPRNGIVWNTKILVNGILKIALTFPASKSLVTMTIRLASVCHTMVHISIMVEFLGPRCKYKSTTVSCVRNDNITGCGVESSRWRHNGRGHISNHQPHDCLLNCFFGRRSKKTLKSRVTGLCEGNTPVSGEFPAQRASNVVNVSIWCRHHWDTNFKKAAIPGIVILLPYIQIPSMVTIVLKRVSYWVVKGTATLPRY